MTDDIPDEPDDDRDADDRVLERHLAALMEHFDAVQIFATRVQRGPEGGNEVPAWTSGRGNWYARYGQIQQWMIMEDQRMRRQMDRILDAEAEEEG